MRKLRCLETAARRLDSYLDKIDKEIRTLAAGKLEIMAKLDARIDRLADERARVAEIVAALKDERLAFDEKLAESEAIEAQNDQFSAELEQIHAEMSQQVEANGRTALEVFVADHLHEAPGYLIRFAEFYERFLDWLPPGEHWSRMKVTRSLPPRFAAGQHNSNRTYLINAAWESPDRRIREAR